MVAVARRLFLCAMLLLVGISHAREVTVDPTQGSPGTNVTVRGTGLEPDILIHIVLYDDDPVASTQTNENGAFTTTFTVPQNAPIGNMLVNVANEAYDRLGKAVFTVVAGSACPSPRVDFSSTSGPIGATSTITGTGWVPGGNVNISLPHGSQALLLMTSITPQVSSTGDWQVDMTVGEGTPLGEYIINFDEVTPDCSLSIQATFIVTPGGGIGEPSQIENPDPRLVSQPIFNRLGGLPPGAYDELNPPPNVEHLVVIIHGWQREGEGYDLKIENKMKSSIETIIDDKRALETEKWYVKVWDWRGQAGPCFFNVDQLELCANIAYANATAQGEALSLEISRYSFKDVHFIAHSAGSNVVQAAIDKLKGHTHPILHTTFLDSYAPSVDKLIYGIGANYAEHYVDKRGDSIPWFSNTNKDLKNTYTFDITELDKTQISFPSNPLDIPSYLAYVHGWPITWYQESIDSQSTGSPFKYGFGLSRENGLDRLPTEFAPPGTCALLSANASCPTSIRHHTPKTISAGTINPLLASLNAQTRQSSSGSVTYDDTGVLLSTGSPAWFEIYETTTNDANFMKFDLEFLSDTGAEGIMTVFIDGQAVYKLDERVVQAGINVEGVWVGDLSPGRHSIGFRLDPFTNVQSIVRISSMQLELLELVEPSVTESDLNEWCVRHGADEARLVNENAYGWYCYTDGAPSPPPINMVALCQDRHGQDYIDFMGDFHNPLSWECFGPVQLLGGINLPQYCMNHGFDYMALSGSTVEDWSCIASDGRSQPIHAYPSNEERELSMAQACREQYNLSVVRARVPNHFDAYSVQCWGAPEN